MKKLLLLIAGILILAGTAMADCGACEGDAKKVEDKAVAAMRKSKCGPDCEKPCCGDKMKGAKKKMKKNKREHPKKLEESKDKASEQAQQKRKKWWKFWGGGEAAE